MFASLVVKRFCCYCCCFVVVVVCYSFFGGGGGGGWAGGTGGGFVEASKGSDQVGMGMGRENRPVYIFTRKLFAKLALRLPLLSSIQTLFYLCFVFVFIKKIFCLFSGTTYVTLFFCYEFQSEQLTIT